MGGKDSKEQKTAKEIIKNLNKNNVDTKNIEIMPGVINDASDIKVSLSGENYITRSIGAIDSFTLDMIEKHKDILLSSDYIIAQTKIPKEITKKLIEFCYANQKFLVLTPCRPLRLRGEFDLLDKISLITCNYEECCKMFGEVKVNEKGEDVYSISEKEMSKVLKKYANKLVVTLGNKGVIFNDGQKEIHMPQLEVDKVVDSTGAGDTLNGNLVASLAEGKSLKDAIINGMLAATYKIQHSGAQTGMPTKKQRNNFAQKYVQDF